MTQHRGLTGLAALAVAAVAHADTLRVPSQYPTIRAAVAAAAPGDEILLADGAYTGPDNRDITLPAMALTIRSEGGRTACTLDAQGASRHLNLTGGEINLEGLTLTGGYVYDESAARGGSIEGRATLVITDCSFTANSVLGECSGRGGALAVNGTVTIAGSTLSGNTASGGTCAGTGTGYGGAIHAAGLVRLVDSELDGNSADLGGAIHGGSLEVIDSVLRGNYAVAGGAVYLSGACTMISAKIISNSASGLEGGRGGGVFVRSGSIVVVNSEFLFNYVGGGFDLNLGGGLSVATNSAVVINSVFALNEVSGRCEGGGSISCVGGTLRLINVTLTRGRGCDNGGVYVYGWDLRPAELLVHNAVFYGNTGAQILIGGDRVDATVEYSLVEGGWPGEGNIDADPLFAPDYSLQGGSPAIDAGSVSRLPPDEWDLDGDGDTTEPLPIDILGSSRRLDDPGAPDTGEGAPPLPDMGAYERDTGCPADCDGDGSLTFSDWLCFQNLFAAGDPGADCDGDGELTFFDFLCFQDAFAAGCP